MSKEEREFLDQLRAKSIEAAAEIMESLQRLKLLYEEISDDGHGGERPAQPRVGDFFYRLAKFELEHASNVIRLGNSQAELIFDHVRQLARRSRGGATPMPVIALELRDGPSGALEYAGHFEIRNPFETEADARFEIGPLRDASGVEVAGARPRVTCGDGAVGPYETARVDVTIDHGAVPTTLFGELTVYLSAATEKQVARRALKVRPAERAR